ncbi:ribonuclease H-like domain-containing protein [Tanacetum coccineum]
MGPFPSSRGNKYILVAVDYLSKWVEAKELPTNDARVVCKFLKSFFARFGTLRAIISDRGTHFCNDQFAKVMLKYGVTRRLSIAYHPQTSRQVEVSNRGLKRFLERTVGKNRASWFDKLDDALWAFRTAFKTPIGCTPYNTGTTKVNTASTKTSTASFSDATVMPLCLSTTRENLQGRSSLMDAILLAKSAIDGARFGLELDIGEDEIQANMGSHGIHRILSMITGFKGATYKRGLEEFKQPEVNEYGPRDLSLKPSTVCDKELDNSKENTDDSLKQQHKTITETSFVKSPLKVDKAWKEKFFYPANHVRVEEPKKAKENNDAPIIEDWVSDDEEEVEPISKVEKKTAIPTATKKESFKPEKPIRRSVRSVNTGIPFSTTGSFNTVRPSYTDHPKSTVHCARPRTYFQNQAQSTVQRPFYKRTTLTKRSYNQNVNTGRQNVNTVRARGFNAVKPSACWVWRPIKPNGASLVFNKYNYIDARGRSKIVDDSGCSRHLSGKHKHLSVFIRTIDGGYVTFGGGANGGRITGKGTIKTDKLDFDDLQKATYENFNALDRRFENDHTYVCLSQRHAITEASCKDETSEILKFFIKEVENLVDKKVKIIRSDNGTEFKNKVMDDFCREKGIKREYSVARTPQQNGVAERKNRTLIEAARTMLADSKLPTTFWAEAVSTACYVQNRVLIVKPHNKTPYELFRGFKPAIGFMKPFGCHVTILNTLDNLGKFDGKSDEGFFVGYSLSSKAFRVYNTRTRKVKENLHIRFLENKLMIEGNGPKWLFDIDSLTQSMNYVPVDAALRSVADAQIQDKDRLHDENDATEKSHDDSSLKENGTVVQQVNTARPEINTSSRQVSTVIPEVNTATPDELDLLLKDILKKRALDYDGSLLHLVARMKQSEWFLALLPTWDLWLPQHGCKCAFLLNMVRLKSIDDIIFGLKEGSYVQQKKKGIFISQDKYVNEILRKYNYTDVKSASTPTDLEKPLVQDGDAADVDEHLYRSMIGSLMYLTTSRPDIMFAVCACAGFSSFLKRTSHLLAVKRIFRYLKGKPSLGLWYSKDSPLELVAYTDSDYAGATQDRKSTTGDLLTKGFDAGRFQYLVSSIGMLNP